MSEVNGLLRAARERTPSRRAPGEHMSRAELAEAVCSWLWATTETKYELDGHYIAKLERGSVRWPRAPYRSGLRAVLNVASDNELGFLQSGNTGLDADLSCSTAGLENDLIDAGDESISMLTLAEESNVGELTVDQLYADIQRITQNYLKTPTRPLFLRSRTVRDRAFKLLGGRQPPTQTRDLYAAAGWALTSLAWMSVDLGRPDAAESHSRTAWACAEAADLDELRAWVRATQHTTAFWQNDFETAGDFAQDGLRYAAGTSAVFLAGAAAVDLARSGRLDEAREALEAAKRVEPRQDIAELGGPFLCTPERAAGLWSDAHLALGEAQHTLDHATTGLALFEAEDHVRRNYGSERMLRLQQVKAHLQLENLDAAAESLAPILATPTEYRVRPLVHRITEVSAMIRQSRFAGDVKARALVEGIREFNRRPGTVSNLPVLHPSGR
jgi:tetratricopeptide (TPR) repeat protein